VYLGFEAFMQHRASVHYRIQLGASQDIHDWQGKYLLEREALCLNDAFINAIDFLGK
jgi:hypothetical protein